MSPPLSSMTITTITVNPTTTRQSKGRSLTAEETAMTQTVTGMREYPSRAVLTLRCSEPRPCGNSYGTDRPRLGRGR